jgi:proton-dependent oligopeptide transporter, POT family
MTNFKKSIDETIGTPSATEQRDGRSLAPPMETPPGAATAGHPPGLYVLGITETWERLSYYGMRALLVLYLTKAIGLGRTDALSIYATYTGLIYLTPLIGGRLADLYLGQRKAVFIGGILMSLGHFAMAFEGLLHFAMGLLILGNGFFKPNISTMVGQLYPGKDARREGAYTIFYMGINVGAFLAPCICGTLGERVGWHWGFGAAGIGMVLGVLVFGIFQPVLGRIGLAPGRGTDTPARLTAADWAHVGLLSMAGIAAVVAAVVPIPAVTRSVPALVKPVLLGYWTILSLGLIATTRLIVGPSVARRVGTTSGHEEGPESAEVPDEPFSREQWERMCVILIISLYSILFWMGLEQGGGTLNLFADQRTDRTLFGYEFPASWYQAVNPLGVIVLAPIFSILWTTLDRTRFKINSVAKMGIGLLLLGVGMVVMMIIDRGATTSNKAGPQWLVIVNLLFTLGELCLSPIGLSLVSSLAPKRVASLMMALWFGCAAAANYLAGEMEAMVGPANLWSFLIATSIASGLILLALNPLLKRMAHGRL